MSEQDPTPKIKRKNVHHHKKKLREQDLNTATSPGDVGLQKKKLDSMHMNTVDEEEEEEDDYDDEENEQEDPFVQILQDPVLYKRLVLTMALQRQPKENKENTGPPPPVITEGFYWKDYVAMESLLYNAMEEYYELSTQQRQSKQQQAFNNFLVKQVRKTASEQNFIFDEFFTDKRLRDRIRCFFKVRSLVCNIFLLSLYCLICLFIFHISFVVS